MNPRILEELYDATEEGLLYGIGLLALPDQQPTPFVHIHYRDWSREKSWRSSASRFEPGWS